MSNMAKLQLKPVDRLPNFLRVLLTDEALEEVVDVHDEIFTHEDPHEASLRIWGDFGADVSDFIAAQDRDGNVLVSKQSLVAFVQHRPVNR